MSKNTINKTIEVSSLAVLLLICFCQIGLAAESSVSVSPQTISASQGDVFNIDIIDASALAITYPFNHTGVKFLPALHKQWLLGKFILCIQDQYF